MSLIEEIKASKRQLDRIENKLDSLPPQQEPIDYDRIKPAFFPILANGSGSVDVSAPDNYDFLTIWNNTTYSVDVYTKADESISNKLLTVSANSRITLPLSGSPFERNLHFKLTGNGQDVILLIFSDENYAIHGDQAASTISSISQLPTTLTSDGNLKVAAQEVAGWTWAKITATGAEDKTVKATPGLVAQLDVEGAITVYLKDGASQAWKTGAVAFSAPLKCLTSIVLNFSAAGNAWILYR